MDADRHAALTMAHADAIALLPRIPAEPNVGVPPVIITPAEIVARAETYLAFLQGKPDDAAKR